MPEGIEDIAKSIQRHRELEIIINATNKAIGRSHVIYNNQDQQIWLINSENLGGGTPIRDINNNVIGRQAGNATTLTGDGFAVYKNLKLGEALIINHEGTHKVKTPTGEFELTIFNRAAYKPSNKDGEFATDIQIKLSGDGKTHSFQDIAKILSLQIQIDDLEKQKEAATTIEEAEQLVQRIAEKEKEKQNHINKAQSFIRKYAELRYQPILDPMQESIKRDSIFSNTLIINGGPGTGKTTSLIQRIKFLISPSIEEYITLTQTQKDILYSEKTSWIFYSPNELLALFLRNSMMAEELTADTEKVKVWTSHKNGLLKIYRFVSETKRPFLIYNKGNGQNLYYNNYESVKAIINGLDSFYINFQKDKLSKVVELDISPFKWKALGQSIQTYVKDKISTLNSIDDLIRLFFNLNELYQKESEEIAKRFSVIVKQIASQIQIVIQKEPNRATGLSDILKKWKVEAQEAEEDDDDDTEIEQEDFDEKEEQTVFDFERELFIKFKSLCRKQALKKFDKNTRFSKRDRELLQLIPEIDSQNDYETLGQTAYFKKYFERIIKGISANILREVPMVYKKYRREQLTSKSIYWNLAMLNELVTKDRNSRIHLDEQALLLSFANAIALNLSKSFQNLFNTLNHPYINGFKKHCKPVIGIDEATDFSIIDLVAIKSFGHPELSSVTLSGDIMQRMTSEGINSWEDFTQLIPNTVVKDLQISYRQSPTLLSLAQAIYEKSTGQRASYQSYIEYGEAEPKPLMIVS